MDKKEVVYPIVANIMEGFYIHIKKTRFDSETKNCINSNQYKKRVYHDESLLILLPFLLFILLHLILILIAT